VPERPTVRPVRVLFSLSRIRPTTNPYLVQLVGAIPDDVEVLFFSWRRALLGRYDVFHVHWPEVLLRRSTRARTVAARTLYTLLLWRLTLTRTPVVRTIHNLEPYEQASWYEQVLANGTDRRTRFWIRLNDRTPVPPGAAARTIPIGEPPAVFTQHVGPGVVPGRLLHFGLVRPYKGIEELVTAFTGLDDPRLRLVIAGRCDDPEYRHVISAAASRDERIELDLRHLGDEELADEVARAELVVLPYRTMHNSSAALLALAMGRPVLVPDLEVTEDLAVEVGEAWVRRYTGMLRAEHLRDALDDVARIEPGCRPRTAGRGWVHIGNAHAEVYQAMAVRGVRRVAAPAEAMPTAAAAEAREVDR